MSTKRKQKSEQEETVKEVEVDLNFGFNHDRTHLFVEISCEDPISAEEFIEFLEHFIDETKPLGDHLFFVYDEREGLMH